MRPEETGDPEASWTKKHHTSAPGSRKWVFGYKAHTLCDAATGLPISIAVTTNSAGDSLLLPELVDTALASYDGWIRRRAALTGATMPSSIIPICWN